MKFLVDVGVGRKVEEILKVKGHNVKSILDMNPGMSDFAILQVAFNDERIIITMDKDFGEMVFHSDFDCGEILLLRLEDMNGQKKSEIVNHILKNFADKIQYNFCVFKKDKFRIRQK